jgi:MoxR-like ATPase
MPDDIKVLNALKESVQKIRGELKKKIIGQENVIEDLLACFLSGGHCLLIGVPGLAKTQLIHSLAKCLHLDFNRVQFTPDLMPSDITGSEILYEDRATGHREFRFVNGPVFSNIVLADEINRTPPKTQSALLQAMQEQEVTSSGHTYKLPQPFWVLATQNPIEQEGTYPLPEAPVSYTHLTLPTNREV